MHTSRYKCAYDGPFIIDVASPAYFDEISETGATEAPVADRAKLSPKRGGKNAGAASERERSEAERQLNNILQSMRTYSKTNQTPTNGENKSVAFESTILATSAIPNDERQAVSEAMDGNSSCFNPALPLAPLRCWEAGKEELAPWTLPEETSLATQMQHALSDTNGCLAARAHTAVDAAQEPPTTFSGHADTLDPDVSYRSAWYGEENAMYSTESDFWGHGEVEGTVWEEGWNQASTFQTQGQHALEAWDQTTALQSPAPQTLMEWDQSAALPIENQHALDAWGQAAALQSPSHPVIEEWDQTAALQIEAQQALETWDQTAAVHGQPQQALELLLTAALQSQAQQELADYIHTTSLQILAQQALAEWDQASSPHNQVQQALAEWDPTSAIQNQAQQALEAACARRTASEQAYSGLPADWPTSVTPESGYQSGFRMQAQMALDAARTRRTADFGQDVAGTNLTAHVGLEEWAGFSTSPPLDKGYAPTHALGLVANPCDQVRNSYGGPWKAPLEISIAAAISSTAEPSSAGSVASGDDVVARNFEI